MLKIEFSGQFKRDYKRAVKRGCDPRKLEKIVTLLSSEEPLPDSCRDHALTNSNEFTLYCRSPQLREKTKSSYEQRVNCYT